MYIREIRHLYSHIFNNSYNIDSTYICNSLIHRYYIFKTNVYAHTHTDCFNRFLISSLEANSKISLILQYFLSRVSHLQGCPRRCSPQGTEVAPGDDMTSSWVERLCPSPPREASGASTGCCEQESESERERRLAEEKTAGELLFLINGPKE